MIRSFPTIYQAQTNASVKLEASREQKQTCGACNFKLFSVPPLFDVLAWPARVECKFERQEQIEDKA